MNASFFNQNVNPSTSVTLFVNAIVKEADAAVKRGG
jgi:hypothetical protein